MGVLVAIGIIIILIAMFFFGLANLGEYGSAGLFLTGLAGIALYKIAKLIYEGYKGDVKRQSPPSRESSYKGSGSSFYSGGGSRPSDDKDDAIDFIIMDDLMNDRNDD